MSELYMMVTITNRKYMSRFAALYRENQIEVGTVSLGMGTASSSILDYMGLEDDEKSICFHFVTAATWKKVKKGLQNQLRIDVPGTGIAFTIPMSSIGGKRELGFLIQGQEFVREEEGTLKETKHELIVAIANYGYNTQVMKAAEEGGATGGTVLHGKGVGMKRAEQFLGVSLVSEKEVIFIVAKSEKKNAIIARLCNTPNPLLWQIAKVRRLTYDLQNIKTKTIAREYIDSLKQEFTAPFLVAETEQLFENAYPSEDAKSYQLPEGKATDIFRNIIKNHPGKVLFVDFWATSCGPCRSGIEATADLRKKYKDHPEFQFIYITGERESPAGAYKQYVEKHLKGEASYYVTGTEYNYLRQLFHFNGIPHYELVEKDGSISNEKLSSYSIGQYLKKRFGTSEPSETEQHAE